MSRKTGPAPDLALRKLIYKLKEKDGLSFRAIAKLVKRSVSNVHELYSKHVRHLSTG